MRFPPPVRPNYETITAQELRWAAKTIQILFWNILTIFMLNRPTWSTEKSYPWFKRSYFGIAKRLRWRLTHRCQQKVIRLSGSIYFGKAELFRQRMALDVRHIYKTACRQRCSSDNCRTFSLRLWWSRRDSGSAARRLEIGLSGDLRNNKKSAQIVGLRPPICWTNLLAGKL